MCGTSMIILMFNAKIDIYFSGNNFNLKNIGNNY